MHFEDSYFVDEIREQFYIPGMIKRSWSMQMEVLKVISDICKKHNIKWFADCGTLIGAVRHGGFVPWDDDLDICMLRPDYIKFNSIISQELPEGYMALNLQLNPEYDDFLTRITNNHAVDNSSEYLYRNHGFPYIAGIDIFPYDYLYDDPDVENERKMRAKKLWDEAEQMEDKSKRPFHEIEKIFMECEGPAKRVTLMPVYIKQSGDSRAIPTKYFDDIISIPFENITINAPAGYINVLKHEYGDWYKVRKDFGLHNYPFFINQQKHLLDQNNAAPYVYVYSGESDDYKVKRQLHAFNSRNAGYANNKLIFMPTCIEDFEGMKYLYNELSLDPNADTYVMPIPYSYRDDNGNPTGWIEWMDDFGDGIRVLKYNEYDFSHEHGYAFVIANPFDEYESGRTVHPFFYSDHIRECADNLIYCYSLPIDEINRDDEKSFASMRNYVISPGVVRADLICLPNESIKYLFMRIWMENLGQDLTAQLFDKLCIVERIKQEALGSGSINQGKKKLIFFASFADYYTYGENALTWVKDSINTFADNKEKLEIIWIEDDTDDQNMKLLCQDIYEEYLSIKSDFRENHGSIVSARESAAQIEGASAFYGSPGYVMHKCSLKGIPVMIRREL